MMTTTIRFPKDANPSTHMQTASRLLDAALTSPQPESQKIIECPICMEEYDHKSHTPMLMQCGHGMCSTCAEQLFPSDAPVQCPTCRTSSTRPLAKNFQLEEQIVLLSRDGGHFLKPSVGSAARMATKTICFAIFGWTALCFMPWFLVPVGVLFCACAMLFNATMAQSHHLGSQFWLRIIGESCSLQTFLPSKKANKWIGTLLMAPLMKPLSAAQDKRFSSRGWLVRCFGSLLGGTSLSHLAVWTFGCLFFPLMFFFQGISGVLKFWVCPFMLMHYFVGSFSSHKQAANSLYQRVFPELEAQLQVPVYKFRTLMEELKLSHFIDDRNLKKPTKVPRSLLSAHSWLEGFMCDLLLRKSDAALYIWELLGMVSFLVWPRVAEFMCDHCVGLETSTTALHSAVVVLPALVFGILFIVWDSTPQTPKLKKIASNVNQAQRRRAVTAQVTSIQQAPQLAAVEQPDAPECTTKAALEDPTTVADVTAQSVPSHEHANESKPWMARPWRLDWKMIVFMGTMHILSVLGVTKLPACYGSTVLFAAVLYFMSGLGITAGAHRLWAHRSYKAALPYRVLMMLFQSLACQGSILNWARDHRVHHKHSEGPADPHNATRGFAYAHFGWQMLHPEPEYLLAVAKVDDRDLRDDRVVMLQHRLDPWFMLFTCFVVPTVLPVLLWGESAVHAFLVAGCLRYALMLHGTWLVNSAAHLWGDHHYNPNINPAENILCTVLAHGEGWHNWHHTYPFDYAASELGVSEQYNPTKLFIDTFAKWGQVWGRKRATNSWGKSVHNRDSTRYTTLTAQK